MTSWHSYPKIYALGHRALAPLMDGPVVIEEKVDGSQFSFGMIGGVLRARSKGQELVIDAPEKMFQAAVDTVKALAPMLCPEWTYRGEYLQKPRHNALAYDRIPDRHVIIFDINTEEEVYLSPAEKRAEAGRLGLETVPSIFEGVMSDVDSLLALLDRVSCLGGAKVEGLVVKNYAKFGDDKKALMGKFVSEAFKEIHRGQWRKDNPTNRDVLQSLIGQLRTPARWDKAVQHLKEAGQIDGSPKDIGAIMKEAQRDVIEECADEIKDQLYRWALPHIRRGVVHGVPEWYKRKLAGEQFDIDTTAPQAQAVEPTKEGVE